MGRRGGADAVAAASAVSNTAATESAASRVAGQPAEEAADAVDVTEGIGVQAERRDAEPAQASGDLGVLRGVVEDDEVRTAREDGFDVGRDAVAQVGHFGGGGRIVAPGGPADDGGAGADGEEQLGRGGNERDDATRGHRDHDRVTRVVHDPGAGRR